MGNGASEYYLIEFSKTKSAHFSGLVLESEASEVVSFANFLFRSPMIPDFSTVKLS